MGKWLKVNGEGIYGTRCSDLENVYGDDAEVFYTKKADVEYAFVNLKAAAPVEVLLKGTGDRKAEALNDKVKFEVSKCDDGLKIKILENESGFDIVGFKLS